MLECDAVVLHIRRGDFVSLGWNADLEFYRESLEKLKNISDYENKKFFVFSDDISWCEQHVLELGLDMFESPDIIFIKHGHEDAWIDLYLMMQGKIIIGSGSGLVRMANKIPSVSQNCNFYEIKNSQILF